MLSPSSFITRISKLSPSIKTIGIKSINIIMAKKNYKYKGKEVLLEKAFKGKDFVLVSFSGNGKGMFKIPSK